MANSPKRKSRIGILTSGGDCAGLNSAMKWVVKTALDERLEWERGIQYEVIGIRDGFKGLYSTEPASPDTEGYLVPLNQEMVRTWDRYGGTMLGTSRFSPYDPKNDTSKQVIENIERLGIDALVVIGGDGSLAIASRLSDQGVNVIGIPKTIDRDLPETDYTLGFDTALNVITEEVDRLRTTAGSHKRIFVVETMGRTAGWLALEGGESCGAFIILIPEYDFSIERLNELVSEGRRAGARYEIILAAEGAKPEGCAEFVKEPGTDSFGHKALGGVAEFVAAKIREGTRLETRSVVLSHLQRGGAPSAFDRRMGRHFGIAAVDLIVRQDFGKMVALTNGKTGAVSLKDIYGKVRRVDVSQHYDADRYNGPRSILHTES
ncbi:MAG: ATP-dependent 6-phosphofructokinase [Dehalococcoidales bacterium]|nr:ATP-dependent 6-phosphofructokinase [Dehalococcoidales bacterium]